MPRKKNRYPRSQKVQPVRPLPPPPARVVPDLPAMPYCHSFITGIDLASTGQPADPAILSAMEKYQEEFPLPTESQSRGCNVVAATAVFAFAAAFITLILWLAKL